jgi:hypothetical protein
MVEYRVRECICASEISNANDEAVKMEGCAGQGLRVNETLVVFAVKSMKTTSGKFKNKRRSACRTQVIARGKGRRLVIQYKDTQPLI